MKVIVPAFGCEAWIERTLASLAMQDHPNFQVSVIDDCSEDRTGDIAKPICEAHGWAFTRRYSNMRAGFNLYTGIHEMQPAPDEPVFILDGDDFLPHERVLSRIEEVYEDRDVWFCYGNYEPWPENTGQVPSRPYPAEFIDDAGNGRLRREENYANHPLTFRYFLFAELGEHDFQDRNKNWLRAGYDRLLVVPMLELARWHHRFVDEDLYRYTSVNPLSDTYVNLREVQEAHRALFDRPPKQPLVEPLPHRQVPADA